MFTPDTHQRAHALFISWEGRGAEQLQGKSCVLGVSNKQIECPKSLFLVHVYTFHIGCRSFCGMVNFLSMYLPNLQRKLIPIYQLTRKGVPYLKSA